MYTVIITDNGPYGCSSDAITLQMTLAPPCFFDSIPYLTHNLCPGGSNGQVILNLGSGWQGSQLFDMSSVSIGMPNQDTISGLDADSFYVVF